MGWKQFRKSKSITKKKKKPRLPKLFQNIQLLQLALPGSYFLPVNPRSYFSPALPIYTAMSEQRGMQDLLRDPGICTFVCIGNKLSVNTFSKAFIKHITGAHRQIFYRKWDMGEIKRGRKSQQPLEETHKKLKYGNLSLNSLYYDYFLLNGSLERNLKCVMVSKCCTTKGPHVQHYQAEIQARSIYSTAYKSKAAHLLYL